MPRLLTNKLKWTGNGHSQLSLAELGKPSPNIDLLRTIGSNLTRHAGSSGSRTHSTELASQAHYTAAQRISPLSHGGRLWWLSCLFIYFFEQLLSSGGLICVIMHNYNRPNGFRDFSIFGFSGWPPSAIFYS